MVLEDGHDTFSLTVAEAAEATCVVLFAVGSGGNPERHFPLLMSLVAHGCTVVAPHFQPQFTAFPTVTELSLRARRLHLALDAFARPGMRVAGVGHSLGATVLLALAGARLCTRAGEPVPVARDARLERLALLTPPMVFLSLPGALAEVRTPLMAWAGSKDTITPVHEIEILRRTLGTEVKVVEGAGHYAFIDQLPPHAVETMPDRERFLGTLAAEVCAFVMG